MNTARAFRTISSITGAATWARCQVAMLSPRQKHEAELLPEGCYRFTCLSRAANALLTDARDFAATASDLRRAAW